MLQAPSGQRINTDSCTFAALIGQQGKCPNRILDVGCGSGVVSLMLSLMFPKAEIIGVEPEDEIAEVARKNFAHPQWQNKITVLKETAQGLTSDAHGRFDLIACNPPYFLNSTPSNDYLRHVARHTTNLMPTDVFKTFTRMLAKNGSAWLSCPSKDKHMWIKTGLAENLYCAKEIEIFDHPAAKPHVSVLCWVGDETAEHTYQKIEYRTSERGDQSSWMVDFRKTWYPARFYKSN